MSFDCAKNTCCTPIDVYTPKNSSYEATLLLKLQWDGRVYEGMFHVSSKIAQTTQKYV